MKIEAFEMERVQSIYENRVKYNLTESGVHPFTITELLEQHEIDHLLSTRLGYGQTNGSETEYFSKGLSQIDEFLNGLI